MPRNGNGTTWKLRMLINIMLAAPASPHSLDRLADLRCQRLLAYRRLGGSAYWLISRHAARAQANKQSSMT